MSLKEHLATGVTRAAHVPPYSVERFTAATWVVVDGRGEHIAMCWTRELAVLLADALRAVSP